MRKLKLEIEQLQVESFTAGGGPGARGTVAAHGPTVPVPHDTPQPIPTVVLCTPDCADSVAICNESIAQHCFTRYGTACAPTPWIDC